MIEVIYDRKKHRVTVKGHAQSGEKGHDLVCAAASILVYTLASDVAGISSDRSKVRRPRIDIREGDATVSCSPVHGYEHVVTLIFDAVCGGFEVLARKYPENIRYAVHKGAGIESRAKGM